MKKIITWFKTTKDVEKTLKWIENNTDYVWTGWNKPTKFIWRKKDFEKYQKKWWFYIVYGDELYYGNINYIDYGYEKINFKDLIKEYREVYVSDISIEDALKHEYKRILITELSWKCLSKYICVSSWEEKAFKNWEKYNICTRKYITKIPVETIEINWKIYSKNEVEERLKELNTL